MSRRVTIADIAKEAGVTPMTVSMALRNHPRISIARRETVQQLAAAMRYRPWIRQSIAACSPRGRLAHDSLVGTVLLRPPQYRQTLDRGVQGLLMKQLAPRGFQPSLFDASELAPERAGEILLARGVESLLVQPSSDADFHGRFPWQHFVSVGFMVAVVPWRIDWVYVDIGRAARESFHIARKRGYQRIGYAFIQEPIEPPDHVAKLGNAWLAYHETAVRHRVPPLEMRVQDQKAFIGWLERYRPDCVIGQVDQMSKMHPSIKKMGFISLRSTDPGLSGWTAGLERVVGVAVNLMEIKVRQRERGAPDSPTCHRVGMRWKEGNSLPWRGPEP